MTGSSPALPADFFAPCMGRIKASASGAASQRARELAALGRDIIALTAGEPDFETPEHIKEAAIAAIRKGDTRYTNVDGTMALKAAICRKFVRENSLDYSPAEITVANGAKQIIFNAMVATLRPGDEVLIPAPYWVSYPEIVKFAGGQPVVLATTANDDFKLKPEALEEAIGPKTRWLVLNSPSNPAGSTYSAAEMQDLTDVLLRHPGVWVLTDDIYEHIVFDGAKACTPAVIETRLRDRTLTVNGVSKAYSMTGWRIGYAGGPAPLIRQIATLQSQSTSNPCSISQAATIAALDGPQEEVSRRAKLFEDRRNLILPKLNAIPGLECRSPRGAFYFYPSCRGLIGRCKPAGGPLQTDADVAAYLLDAANVAVVHGAAYGLSPHFRLSFAIAAERLEEACIRMAAACEALA